MREPTPTELAFMRCVSCGGQLGNGPVLLEGRYFCTKLCAGIKDSPSVGGRWKLKKCRFCGELCNK